MDSRAIREELKQCREINYALYVLKSINQKQMSTLNLSWSINKISVRLSIFIFLNSFGLLNLGNNFAIAPVLARSEPLENLIRKQPSDSRLEQQQQQLRERQEQIRTDYQQEWDLQQQRWRNRLKNQQQENQEYRRQNQERIHQQNELRILREKNRQRRQLIIQPHQ